MIGVAGTWVPRQPLGPRAPTTDHAPGRRRRRHRPVLRAAGVAGAGCTPRSRWPSSRPGRCEVVVVDDGSAAAAAAAARRLPVPGPAPAPARPRVPPGRGPQPRRGVDAAADVLVFLDADTLPEPATIARLAAWPASLPDALVVGRRRHVDLAGLDAGGDAGVADRRRVRRRPGPAIRRGCDGGYDASGDLLDVDDRSYRYVISAVMACHRWLYDDIGGFDATRDEYGSDDWELAAPGVRQRGRPGARPGRGRLARRAGLGRARRPVDGKNRQDAVAGRSVVPSRRRGAHLPARRPTPSCGSTDLDGATVGQVVATVDSLLAAVPDAGIRARPTSPPGSTAHVAHDPRIHIGPPTDAPRRPGPPSASTSTAPRCGPPRDCSPPSTRCDRVASAT